MESILNKRRPVAVAFVDDDVIVTLSDGSKLSNPLDWHWWLEAATEEQLNNYEIYASSIFWPDLDEGLDIEAMLRGLKSKHSRQIAK